MNHSLIADLKEMLLAALDMGDYAKVKKFAGYLEGLTATPAVPVKHGRRPNAAKIVNEVKVSKKRGRPAKAKPAMEVIAETVQKETAAEPAEAAKDYLNIVTKIAKATKILEARQTERETGKQRGLSQFAPGTRLKTHFKDDDLVITVLEGSAVGHNGTAYPSLAQFVDTLAGKHQARHLRTLGNWKVVG